MRLKNGETEPEIFMTGDWVEWTSQSRGAKTTKKGQVICWVESGILPGVSYQSTPISRELQKKYSLSPVSWNSTVQGFRVMCDPWETSTQDRYVVIVPTPEGRQNMLYMPRAKGLVRVDE